jgi:hypothetical protein
MRQAIHHHYDQLTDREKFFVDKVFDLAFIEAGDRKVDLVGDDRVERAVDALARAVLESRPKEVPNRLRATLEKPVDADPPIDGAMEVHLALKGAGLL